MVDNVGVAVGIAAPSLAVQKLFPLPVSLTAMLNFGSRTTSGTARSDTVKSGMVNNVRIAVGIAAPSLAVQEFFSTFGFC